MSAPILPPVVEAELVFELDAEVENEIIKECAQEINDEMRAWIIDLLDNPPSPAVKLGPKDQFERYMLFLVIAYPTDEAGRIAELNWLINPEYVDMIKAGAAPPPQAMPWRGLLPVYFAFEEVQKRFMRLYDTYAPETP